MVEVAKIILSSQTVILHYLHNGDAAEEKSDSLEFRQEIVKKASLFLL
jgi:hypothetical protein